MTHSLIVTRGEKKTLPPMKYHTPYAAMINEAQETLKQLRKEEDELQQEVNKQSIWLAQNRKAAMSTDPMLWHRRATIYGDRMDQLREIRNRIVKELDHAWGVVDQLEGTDREKATALILQWEEPPF